MNPHLAKLQPYPFQRLKELCSDITPDSNYTPIDLSIGEPKHNPPEFVIEALKSALSGVNKYPPTPGSFALREAIAAWASHRFQLPEGALNPADNVLPVNGTREALFAIAHCLVDPTAARPLIVMPNPFYQIYEGAALLAGAQPWFYHTDASSNYQPDFEDIDPGIWQQCQLLYLCTPGNPSGTVLSSQMLQQIIELSLKHNFVIVSDECYSEIYPHDNAPPAGLLQAAAAMGNSTFKNCIAFNSLSKRSNLPGLRSGFVAGQKELIKSFLLYRTYHGSAMPLPTDAASQVAWKDEAHVRENRQRYRRKYQATLPLLQQKLNISQPDAGFFLWPKLTVDDTEFTRTCLAEKNVKILPGSYLARNTNNGSPGDGQIRLALVASEDQCVEAVKRVAELL